MKKHEHYKHGGFDGAMADVYYDANAPLPALYSPTKLQSGIVTKFSKTMAAHGLTTTLGCVKGVRQGSIEYATEKDAVRGWALTTMLFFVPLEMGVMYLATLVGSSSDWWLVWLGSLALFLFGLVLVIYTVIVLLRTDLFRFTNQGIIFDRKNRKVYRQYQHYSGSLWNILTNSKIISCEYEWDLVDAVHYAQCSTNGVNLVTNHHLVFNVRRSATDATVIDQFIIANPIELNEGLVSAMWEHIRRYMEEDGPPLGSPPEAMATPIKQPSWWQCLAQTHTFGPGYVQRWKTNTGWMMFAHLLFPVFLPFFALVASCAWLSYYTEIDASWPEEVLAKIGEPVQVG